VACRVTSPVFSPDGKRVLLASWSLNAFDGGWNLFDGVFVADVKDAAVRQVIAPPSDFVRIGICRVAWSPDGKRIAFGYHRKTGDDDQFEFRVVSYTPDGSDPRTVFSVTGTREEVAPLLLEGWR
jgi:Tol biopolymer transport system component